jgi:hypothetical protein
MGRAKKSAGADGSSAPEEAAGDGGATSEKKGKDLVREVIDKYGPSIKPKEIYGKITEEMGRDINMSNISSWKSQVLRERGIRLRKRRRPGRPPGSGTTATPVQANSPSADDLFHDIRVVREIGARLGPARLREVVDMLFPGRGAGPRT